GAISGTYANLPDGSTVNLAGAVYLVSYEGGDGNNLTLTLVAPTTVYVGENSPTDFTITNDVGAPGLSNGDTVTWNPGGGQHHAGQVAGLIFGYNAFTSVQSGVNAVAATGTVDVEAGTYAEAITINRPLTLLGAQTGQNADTRFAGFTSGPNG